MVLNLSHMIESKEQNKKKSQSRILVIRTDRLGDVILSTPVFKALKNQYPDSFLVFCIPKKMASLFQKSSEINELFLYDPDNEHQGIKGWFLFLRQMKKYKFSVVVALYTQWKIGLAVLFSNIPKRIGPLSKLHSFFCYNKGMRQHRSYVEMHEVDYNLQLLRPLGIHVKTRTFFPFISLSDDVITSSKKWLSSQGWKFHQKSVLVHPGMGGSALNWPEESYSELIEHLIDQKKQVLITGGPLEISLLKRIEKRLGEKAKEAFFYFADFSAKIDFLAGLCYHVDVIVAPSTGPLHLACALKKKIVTFYPPIKVQSAIRWGPYLQEEQKAVIFVPEIYCGQDFFCLGSQCHYFFCMKNLSVENAFLAIEEHLKISHN